MRFLAVAILTFPGFSALLLGYGRFDGYTDYVLSEADGKPAIYFYCYRNKAGTEEKCTNGKSTKPERR